VGADDGHLDLTAAPNQTLNVIVELVPSGVDNSKIITREEYRRSSVSIERLFSALELHQRLRREH
jgi:hypothetical protein